MERHPSGARNEGPPVYLLTSPPACVEAREDPHTSPELTYVTFTSKDLIWSGSLGCNLAFYNTVAILVFRGDYLLLPWLFGMLTGTGRDMKGSNLENKRMGPHMDHDSLSTAVEMIREAPPKGRVCPYPPRAGWSSDNHPSACLPAL